jgi:VWFA-related protein
VYEDGVPQRIEFFSDHTVPVATGLIIDNSSSTMTRRSMVSAGVKAFAASSRESDEMFTIVFNEHVRFGLPGGVPFTENRALLQGSFERYRPGGMTALHDAVVEGLAHLETATLQKRALVVLSDGDDNASHQSESNMLYRAARSQALIYTIWTGDLSTAEGGNRGLLRRLATRSGGQAYEPEAEEQVVAAFSAIAGNIRRVYSIGYAPTNTARDGTYRRVKVLVRAPGKSYTVSTREGYMADDDAERH